MSNTTYPPSDHTSAIIVILDYSSIFFSELCKQPANRKSANSLVPDRKSQILNFLKNIAQLCLKKFLKASLTKIVMYKLEF